MKVGSYFKIQPFFGLPALNCRFLRLDNQKNLTLEMGFFPFNKEIDFPKSISKTQMDTYHRWMEVTVFASMFQLPTISLPVGFNAEGLPMGMQLIGKNKSDEKVIQIGKYYEEIFNHSKIKPNIING